MAERRLVILKHSGKTPTMGMCERCQLKFFTLRELTRRPAEAEQNLREKFKSHVCKHEGHTSPRPIRKVRLLKPDS
jgi:hypothetical protein